MAKTNGQIRKFIPYFAKYKKVLIFDLLCALLTTLCEIYLPLIVRFLTDKASTNISALSVNLILSIGAFYIVLKIIDCLAYYYMSSVGHIMGAKIETDMRRDLFSHLQKLSFSYYDETKIGQIMARITSDLFDVTEFAHHCPEEFFIAGVKIIVSFIILAFINIWLTLIIFSIIPIMLLTSIYFRTKMKEGFKKSRVQIGELNSQVEDSLLGIRVVKSFVNEEIEEEKFKKGNNFFLTIKENVYKYMALFHSNTRIFDGIMYIVVVIVGGIFMLDGKITPGDYMAYLLFVTTLLATVRRIVEFTEQFQRGMTGIERFFEILDTPVEIIDKPNSKELTNIKGEIRFENVCFKYSDNHDYVLENLNLHINVGSKVAIVGPSGAGKTTLCNLIPRFYELSDGNIYIDKENIKDVTIKSLRNSIGMVQQDVYLFSGTVLENISYGNPNATKEEVIKAAKLSGAHDFIINLKNGYDTYVGERGVKLSGGQKQRISIARVFLKNPKILILDEATSSLDNESEQIVHSSLEELAKGRTTLTIAHRLTTIKNADIILVLTENGIEEKGSHDELMNLNGIYANFYNKTFN